MNFKYNLSINKAIPFGCSDEIPRIGEHLFIIYDDGSEYELVVVDVVHTLSAGLRGQEGVRYATFLDGKKHLCGSRKDIPVVYAETKK